MLVVAVRAEGISTLCPATNPASGAAEAAAVRTKPAETRSPAAKAMVKNTATIWSGWQIDNDGQWLPGRAVKKRQR